MSRERALSTVSLVLTKAQRVEPRPPMFVFAIVLVVTLRRQKTRPYSVAAQPVFLFIRRQA